jgi:hypothetical protein
MFHQLAFFEPLLPAMNAVLVTIVDFGQAIALTLIDIE